MWKKKISFEYFQSKYNKVILGQAHAIRLKVIPFCTSIGRAYVFSRVHASLMQLKASINNYITTLITIHSIRIYPYRQKLGFHISNF